MGKVIKRTDGVQIDIGVANVDSYNSTATAFRRVLVDSSGNYVTVAKPKTEVFMAGSALSGVDGATNRVATLNNTSLTTKVYVTLGQNGLGQSLFETTGFTVSHLAASTTVTILVAVFNADTIRFEYEN